MKLPKDFAGPSVSACFRLFRVRRAAEVSWRNDMKERDIRRKTK